MPLFISAYHVLSTHDNATATMRNLEKLDFFAGQGSRSTALPLSPLSDARRRGQIIGSTIFGPTFQRIGFGPIHVF